MVYLAVNSTGSEVIANSELFRGPLDLWSLKYDYGAMVDLPKGSIKKLIGRDLTWEDEPVKIE